MNRENLIQEITNLGINITEVQISQIDIFCDFLIEYNQHTNLTAIIDKEQVYLKHVYDSLTLVNIFEKLDNIKTMLDIGSGAGFPGIIFKIVFPNIHITLLDSNNKKTTFLKEAINLLHLNNIDVANKRAEDYIKGKRESFDLVTARAVAASDILLEIAVPFVKKNGFFVAMKGNFDTTLENLNYITKELGCSICTIKEFSLPFERSHRTLIKITKKKPTNTKYPRPYNKIVKNPLKNIAK